MTTSTKNTAKAVITKKAVISAYADLKKAEKTAKDKYVVFMLKTLDYYNSVIVTDKKIKDTKKALKGLLEECGLKHPHSSEYITNILFLSEKVGLKRAEACLKANSVKEMLEVARRANEGKKWKMDKNGVLVIVEKAQNTPTTTKGGKQAPKAETTTTKGSEQPKEQVNRVTSDEVTTELDTLDELFTQLENINLSFCSAETLTKYAKILGKINDHIKDVARQKKFNIKVA